MIICDKSCSWCDRGPWLIRVPIFFLFTEDVSPWYRAGYSPVLRTSPSHRILTRNIWLDKPARISFSCSLDLLLISDQTNTYRDIRDGNWQLVRLQRFYHSAAEHNFCSKQFYGEQPSFLKWLMYTIQESTFFFFFESHIAGKTFWSQRTLWNSQPSRGLGIIRFQICDYDCIWMSRGLPLHSKLAPICVCTILKHQPQQFENYSEKEQIFTISLELDIYLTPVRSYWLTLSLTN